MDHPIKSLSILFFGFIAVNVHAQNLELFDVNDGASSRTSFRDADLSLQTDIWSGNFDLGITGTTSGGSSLPNPGNEASGSGAFFADHQFGLTSWNLSGWAQSSIDAGLGATSGLYPSIGNTTVIGSSLYFYVIEPFTITLTGSVLGEFTGSTSGPSNPTSNEGYVRLYAEILDGILVNQFLTNWSTTSGDLGGTYTATFNSGVFRLSTGATAVLSSNVPDAYGTQYSSYNAQLSIQPIPEPSSALLLAPAALYLLLRRRRKRNGSRPGNLRAET